MGFSDPLITTADQLEQHYGEVFPPSIAKEIDHVSAHYHAFIEAAPFFALATSGPEGLDCSPRGDAVGRCASRRSQEPAVDRHDHGGDHRRPAWRRGARPHPARAHDV